MARFADFWILEREMKFERSYNFGNQAGGDFKIQFPKDRGVQDAGL